MIHGLIAFIIFAVVLIIVAVIIVYILQQLPVPGDISRWVIMAIWLIVLLVLLLRALPLLGLDVAMLEPPLFEQGT